jgi:hypothetical protein
MRNCSDVEQFSQFFGGCGQLERMKFELSSYKWLVIALLAIRPTLHRSKISQGCRLSRVTAVDTAGTSGVPRRKPPGPIANLRQKGIAIGERQPVGKLLRPSYDVRVTVQVQPSTCRIRDARLAT